MCQQKKMRSRRDWHEIIQSNEKQDARPKLLYKTKVSYGMKWQIKNFSDKKKMKNFITTKPGFFILNMLIDFKERKGKRETMMWESNINWLPPICTMTGDWTHKLGMCLTRKWTPNFWCTGQCSNQLSNTS